MEKIAAIGFERQFKPARKIINFTVQNSLGKRSIISRDQMVKLITSGRITAINVSVDVNGNPRLTSPTKTLEMPEAIEILRCFDFTDKFSVEHLCFRRVRVMGPGFGTVGSFRIKLRTAVGTRLDIVAYGVPFVVVSPVRVSFFKHPELNDIIKIAASRHDPDPTVKARMLELSSQAGLCSKENLERLAKEFSIQKKEPPVAVVIAKDITAGKENAAFTLKTIGKEPFKLSYAQLIDAIKTGKYNVLNMQVTKDNKLRRTTFCLTINDNTDRELLSSLNFADCRIKFFRPIEVRKTSSNNGYVQRLNIDVGTKFGNLYLIGNNVPFNTGARDCICGVNFFACPVVNTIIKEHKGTKPFTKIRYVTDALAKLVAATE